MELTGGALPIVLAAFACLFLALVVIGRPAFRRRWASMLARGVMTVLFAASVLALVAALFNNEYAFYSSWSDLVGAPSKGSQTQIGDPVAAGRTAVTAGALTQVATPPELPPLPQPGARLQHYRLAGPRTAGGSSAGTRDVVVRLPAGYDPAKATTYPVIVAMHGLPASPKSFTALGGFYSKLDAAEAAGRIRPAIVLVPQLNHSPHDDNECVDAPHGDQTETWLAHDLPAWMMAHYKVASDRSSWATWGYSYGGWCAAMVAMKHPGTFGAAVAFQGYYRAEFMEKPPFAASSAAGESYDLAALERRHAPPVSLWIFACQGDGASYPSTRRFLDSVKTPTAVTAFIGKGGGHRISVWSRHIPQTFEWLGETQRGFSPSGRPDGARPTHEAPAPVVQAGAAVPR